MVSNANIKPSSRAAIAGVVSPVSQGAGSVSTGWVDMQDFDTIMATVLAGVLGASATLDAKLEQATSSGGAGAKDITGKTITQLTKASSDDGKQAVINCRADELDVTNNYRFARLTLTVATAASLVCGVIHGFDSRYQPPVQAATVDSVN